MPSTIYNGSLPARSEPTPRMTTEASPPGLTEPVVTCTPAASPCRAVVTVPTLELVRCSDLIEATAPVRSLFLAIPYPIATTSSRLMASAAICILMTFCFPIVTDCFTIPTNENSRILPFCTLMV